MEGIGPIREALTQKAMEKLQRAQNPEAQLGDALAQTGDNLASLVNPNIKYRDTSNLAMENQVSAYDALVKAQQLGMPEAKEIGGAIDTFLGKDSSPQEKAAIAEWLNMQPDLTPNNIMTMTARGVRELGIKGGGAKPTSGIGKMYDDEQRGLLPPGTTSAFVGKQTGMVTPPPSGYRTTPNGLEPIPGGPADIKLDAASSKAYSALQGLKQQGELVSNTINDALKKISGWSTGYGYMALSGLPNTDARALDNDLQTIKTNIGFDKLQEMRANSPTGGALGNVSDSENKMLQAVQGALDPMQKDQLVKNLTAIKELYPVVIKERQEAYNRDYARGMDISPSIGASPSPSGIPAQSAAIQAALDAGYTEDEIADYLGSMQVGGKR